MPKDLIPIQLGEDFVTRKSVEIDSESLRQHLYIVGKTGCGKSTLLFNLVTQVVDTGGGVCLLDPHGDLVDEVLAGIPKHRTPDVLLVEPGDASHSVAWNPLYNVPGSSRPRVAQGILSAMRGIWGESWGPRMEYILYNGLRLLLDAERESLLGLQRLLVDAGYRGWLVGQTKDPVVARFWEQEFGSWDQRFRREAIAPIQNKIGQILGDPALRAILGQSRSRVDLRFLMDRSRIVLVNLSKGHLGEDSAGLLGSLLVASFQEVALSRAELSESDRRLFLLVVDEFHNFTTTSFASMLSEVRKYGLGLVLSNQYLAQLQTEVRDAVLGNVGSHLVFRVSGEDALSFCTEFGSGWRSSRFADLPPFQAIARICSNGSLSNAQQIRTFPPQREEGQSSDRIRIQSNMRYGVPKKIAVKRIANWQRRKLSRSCE